MQMYFVINSRNPGCFMALNPAYSLSRAVPRLLRIKTQELTKQIGALFATPYMSEAEAFINNAPPGVLREMMESNI